MKAQPITRFLNERGFEPITSDVRRPDLAQVAAALGFDGISLDHAGETWGEHFEVNLPWAARAFPKKRPSIVIDRFVDGMARVTTLASYRDPTSKERKVVLGGVVSAAALRLVDGRPKFEPPVEFDQHACRVVALDVSGFEEEEIAKLRTDLIKHRIELLDVDSKRKTQGVLPGIAELEKARIVAHSRVTEEMGQLEVSAAAREGRKEREIVVEEERSMVTEMTVVDGQLKNHLSNRERHGLPLIGVIKRHQVMRLDEAYQDIVEHLDVGERTPAFPIRQAEGSNRPDVISWYVKISGGRGTGFLGTVRAEVSKVWLQAEVLRRMGLPEEQEVDEAEQEFLSVVTALLDEISYELLAHRAVKAGYDREDCSLQPVVLIEDYLHSAAGDIHYLQMEFKRVLGLF